MLLETFYENRIHSHLGHTKYSNTIRPMAEISHWFSIGLYYVKYDESNLDFLRAEERKTKTLY